MRRSSLLSLVPLLAPLLGVGLITACPPGRQVGGEGEGEGEGEGPVGAACDIGGLDVGVDTAAPAAAKQTGGAPDVSCIGTPRVVSASTAVTLEGCVDIFGVGNRAQRGITVSVYDAADNPKTGVPLATGTVFIRDDAATLAGGCAANPTEPACLAFDCDSEGYYRLDGTIPTHVPLTMKIAAANSTNVIDTYLWGLVFFDDQAVAGSIIYEAALIFASTYASIPTLSGRQITGGQTIGDGAGRAVIAGELHDCADVIIGEGVIAMEDFDPASMTLAYFDGDADDPKPDLTRSTSASDGLYAILNVTTDGAAATHRVVGGFREACTGDDCTCISLGERTVTAFPDSVAIVTLRGDFPVIQ
ncbi:MAG: hypothetical protein Q8O67_11780 [Deltaproteobacteria bacterium]|nr:hypothetical protein [Deltaproteobacteria bacterium]